MTLTSALADLYRRLGFSSSPDAVVTTRLTSHLNEAQQDVLAKIGGRRLVHGTVPFASVANQAEYGLPPSIARVLSIRDTANNRRLDSIPESTYRIMLPSTSSATGTPYAYAALGRGPMVQAIATAGTLFVISTSAGDVQTLYYEVVDTTGLVITGSVSVNGITGVQLGTSATIAEIRDVYLSSVAVGTVTIRQTSGAGTIIGTIGIGKTRTVYERIALITTPSGALTYAVDYEWDATDLVNATDEFPVPVRFGSAVKARALCYEYLSNGDANRYAMTDREYQRSLGELNHYLVSGPDQLIVPGGNTRSPSILPGGWPWDGYGIR